LAPSIPNPPHPAAPASETPPPAPCSAADPARAVQFLKDALDALDELCAFNKQAYAAAAHAQMAHDILQPIQSCPVPPVHDAD